MRNASSGASSFDLFAFAPPGGYTEPLRSGLLALDALQQKPGAYRLAPHLLTSCNHSLFHSGSVDIPNALPELTEGRAITNPVFRGMAQYCKNRVHHRWPRCPATRRRHKLLLEQVFFVVVTTSRLVRPRGSVLARVLRRQNASFAIFSDAPAPGVHPLPVTGHLERITHNRTMRKHVSFIAQKHLELLHTLASDDSVAPRGTRWWVVLDDDSFVFVDRYVQTLGLVDDALPLLVGGAVARSHLCADGLCDYREFTRRNGFAPVVHALAGGATYALNAAGLRRIGHALSQDACLDATLGDLATAACARAAGVRIMKLPGGWMVNDGSIAGAWTKREKERTGRARSMTTIKHEVIESATFTGQLISVHKLPDRQALCWAEHGECSPRCDCACSCAHGATRTPSATSPQMSPSVRRGATGTTSERARRGTAASGGSGRVTADGLLHARRILGRRLASKSSGANEHNLTAAAWLPPKGRLLPQRALCEEPPGSTCDFDCPADVWDDLLQPQPPGSDGHRSDVDGSSALAVDGVRICAPHKEKDGA